MGGARISIMGRHQCNGEARTSLMRRKHQSNGEARTSVMGRHQSNGEARTSLMGRKRPVYSCSHGSDADVYRDIRVLSLDHSHIMWQSLEHCPTSRGRAWTTVPHHVVEPRALSHIRWQSLDHCPTSGGRAWTTVPHQVVEPGPLSNIRWQSLDHCPTSGGRTLSQSTWMQPVES